MDKVTDGITLKLSCVNGSRLMHYRRQLFYPTQAAGIAMAAIAMSASIGAHREQMTRFDADSYPIGVDNRCSACISHKIEDFEDDIRPSNRVIKGFGGTQTAPAMIGIINWQWEDNLGKVHKFCIKDSYFVPEGGVRLLLPQHWAKNAGHGKPKRNGAFAGETTTNKKCTLWWNSKKFKLTIPLSKRENVATLHSAPGIHCFEVFCQKTEAGHDCILSCRAQVGPPEPQLLQEYHPEFVGEDFA